MDSLFIFNDERYWIHSAHPIHHCNTNLWIIELLFLSTRITWTWFNNSTFLCFSQKLNMHSLRRVNKDHNCNTLDLTEPNISYMCWSGLTGKCIEHSSKRSELWLLTLTGSAGGHWSLITAWRLILCTWSCPCCSVRKYSSLEFVRFDIDLRFLDRTLRLGYAFFLVVQVNFCYG